MTSNNAFDQLKSLIRSISLAHKQWTAKKAYPSLGEISGSVQSWSSQFARLRSFNNLTSHSLTKAVEEIENAWDNRDDREKSIAHVGKALEALKAVTDELDQPEYKAAYENRSAKSLWGAAVAYSEASVAPVLLEIHDIRRRISAVAAAKALDDYDNIDMRQAVEQLVAIANRYDPSTANHQYALKAAQELNQGNSKGRTALQRQHYQRAVKMLETLYEHIKKTSQPVGYKADMDSSDIQDIESQVNKMQTMVYGYEFYTPQELLPKLRAKAVAIAKYLEGVYNPRAARITSNIIAACDEAIEYAKTSSVKSMSIKGWQHQGVQANFNVAIDHVDQLKRHLKG